MIDGTWKTYLIRGNEVSVIGSHEQWNDLVALGAVQVPTTTISTVPATVSLVGTIAAIAPITVSVGVSASPEPPRRKWRRKR